LACEALKCILNLTPTDLEDFKVRGRGFRGTDDGLYQVVVDDTHIKGLSEVVWIDWCSQERKWFTETRGRVNTVAMVDEF